MVKGKRPPQAPVLSVRKAPVLDNLADVSTELDPAWAELLGRTRRSAGSYGFSPLLAPPLEDAALYGGASEQLVTFELGKRTAAVPPHPLPALLRAYAQAKLAEGHTLSKWFSEGWATTHLGGRLRASYAVCFEVLGQFTQLTEAQLLCCGWELLSALGLPELALEVNSTGSRESQSVYSDVLHGFLHGKRFDLCDTCAEGLSAGRPFEVLRCQNLGCQTVVAEAPTALDFLDQPSQKRFTLTLEALDELQLPYQLAPHLVGPEGWGGTAVSFVSRTRAGATRLAEAGGHDELLASAGKKSPAFGLALDLSAVRAACAETQAPLISAHEHDVFLVPLGELASKRSLKLFRDLLAGGVLVHDHFGTAGVKNQLKLAEAARAPLALILGQKEAVDDVVILRDVKSGMQEVISYDKIVSEVKKRLGR